MRSAPPLIQELARHVLEWARGNGIHGFIRVREVEGFYVVIIRIPKAETVMVKASGTR